MTVNLTRIYTRLGDGGETHLGDMSRVPKTDPRIEAYGTVDELNSQLGVALTIDELDQQHAAWIRHIQNDLFDVGADIAAPEDSERERLRVLAEQTAWLEQRCDEVNAEPAAAEVVRASRRDPRGRTAARLPDRVPPRRAARDRVRRSGQPRDGPLPQPALGPAVHPEPRRQRRRRATLGARPLPLIWDGTGRLR